MKKALIRNLIILLIMPAAGFLFLLLVHLLPTERMKSNVYSSIDTIEAECFDELLVDEYKATMSGNFTDCLMLHYAIYDGDHSTLDQSLNMYRSESDPEEEWWPGRSLLDYLNGVEISKEVSYPRYWHGYLVFLKPLLLFTSLNSLRLFNAGLELLLLALILISFSKKGYSKLALSFAASLPFMFFFSSFASLSLSICMYILLIEMLIIANFNEKLNQKERYTAFFLIAGAATSYFDFLTYPLVTLSIPLIAVIVMNEKKISKSFISMIKHSIFWAVGYVFMWASKWLIAAAIFGKGAIGDALNTISQRTSSVEGGRFAGFLNILKLNLSPFANRAFALILLFIVIIVAVEIIKTGIFKNLAGLLPRIPLLLIGITPFVWWFVTSNHSMEHWMFTCRIFSIFVFALLCVICGNTYTPKKKD